MTKALIVVDMQYDFINGSLAIPYADKIIDNVVKSIKSGYDNILLTQDFHPETHCSFIDNNGIWPRHCVQFSEGASIHEKIIKATTNKNITLIRKGMDPNKEEYSGFTTKMMDTLISEHVTTVDVCGLATDYCVKSTIIDIKKHFPSMLVNILTRCCAGVNTDTTARALKEMEKLNININ